MHNVVTIGEQTETDKNPEQRFQSASDLAFALEALSDFSSDVRSFTRDSRREVKQRFWRIGLAVLAVAVVSFGYFVLRSAHSRSTDDSQIHSIAVLPFANATNDSQMDYLSEGLSEELTNSLSRLPNLRVMARSIVAHYRSREDNPQALGRDLHVDAVLTGRLEQHGNELGLEAELVNVGDRPRRFGVSDTLVALRMLPFCKLPLCVISHCSCGHSSAGTSEIAWQRWAQEMPRHIGCI